MKLLLIPLAVGSHGKPAGLRYEREGPDPAPSEVHGIVADSSGLNQHKWKLKGLACVSF